MAIPILILIGLVNLLAYHKFGQKELGGEAMRERERLEIEQRDAEGGEELLLEALLVRAVGRRVALRKATKQGKNGQEPVEERTNANHMTEEESKVETEALHVPQGVEEDNFFLPSNRWEARTM